MRLYFHVKKGEVGEGKVSAWKNSWAKCETALFM